MVANVALDTTVVGGGVVRGSGRIITTPFTRIGEDVGIVHEGKRCARTSSKNSAMVSLFSRVTRVADHVCGNGAVQQAMHLKLPPAAHLIMN